MKVQDGQVVTQRLAHHLCVRVRVCVCVCAQVYVSRHMSVCARECVCMWMRVYQAGVFRGKMGLFGDSACLGA